jgi:hypothetical protein
VYILVLQKPQDLQLPESSFGVESMLEALLNLLYGDKLLLVVLCLAVLSSNDDPVSPASYLFFGT